MLCKAKTESGAWIHGFLIGYYNTVERESVESYAVFEGIKGVDAIKVKQETVCEFVCFDRDGNRAYTNDYIQLEEGERYVQCLLVKEDNGFSIFPNYQNGSLYRLSIDNGIGNFKVIGNKFDDNGKLSNYLEMKSKWFENRVKGK